MAFEAQSCPFALIFLVYLVNRSLIILNVKQTTVVIRQEEILLMINDTRVSEVHFHLHITFFIHSESREPIELLFLSHEVGDLIRSFFYTI